MIHVNRETDASLPNGAGGHSPEGGGLASAAGTARTFCSIWTYRSPSPSRGRRLLHRKARRHCEWRGWWAPPAISLCRGLCPTEQFTPQGGRMSPSGDALSPPLQRQLQGSASTIPDPLASQGFCWIPEHLAEPTPASRLASNDHRRYFSTRGPGPAHTWSPCWGALSAPRPGAPSMPGTHTLAYTQPCHRPGGKQVAGGHRPGTSWGQ